MKEAFTDRQLRDALITAMELRMRALVEEEKKNPIVLSEDVERRMKERLQELLEKMGPSD